MSSLWFFSIEWISKQLMEIFPAYERPTVGLEEEQFYFTLIYGKFPGTFFLQHWQHSDRTCSRNPETQLQCSRVGFYSIYVNLSRVIGRPAVTSEKYSSAKDKKKKNMQWGKPLCSLKLMFWFYFHLHQKKCFLAARKVNAVTPL